MANTRLGVTITTDRVNDFFSLNMQPKGASGEKRIPPPAYSKHRVGLTARTLSSSSSGPRTPDDVNDENPFDAALNEEIQKLELENFEDTGNLVGPIVPEHGALEVYDNYSFIPNYDPNLPITEHRQLVLETIESSQVTIIQGATGSGKTTQVPQYILDHYCVQRKYCNILVTQPRRIAAVSIAKRVSHERGWPLGMIVGYQVARDRKTSDDTRITYMTTGVLLQKLIKNKSVDEYTHIILDEVHERDQDIDFSMLVVRKYMRSVSKHIKVVLMSATAETSLYSQYFSIPIRGRLEGAPAVSVEGRLFDVKEYYLDDLRRTMNVQFPDMTTPGIDDAMLLVARRIIKDLDNRERAKEGITNTEQMADVRGTVLVFLSGLPDIRRMMGVLDDIRGDLRLELIPLHSQITDQEQSKVFLRPKSRFRKVILSTNIAESSITIPDVKYVIDFCLTKNVETDRESNYQSLKLCWASQSSLIQRKGRAGRVSNGECFRLIAREAFGLLDEFCTPELQRCPLEQVVLKVKLLELGSPCAVLRLAIQPPAVHDIQRTVLMLKEVGALTVMQDGKINSLDGDLTFIGRVLGTLPVDIRVGKLIVLGLVFGFLEECLVIGAALSLKSIFARPFKKDFEAYRQKMQWSDWSFSDCITILNAYKEWKSKKMNSDFGRDSEHGWGVKNFIQVKVMGEVDQLVSELVDRLVNFNIKSQRHLRSCYSQDELLILKVILAGAFYPFYFASNVVDEEDAYKALSGHDHTTTVMLQGVPPPGKPYSNLIAKLVRRCGNGRYLYFESSRCFVEFAKPSASWTGILPEVYLAVRLRQLNTPMVFYVSKKKRDEVRKKYESLLSERDTKGSLKTGRLTASIERSRMAIGKGECTPKQVRLKKTGYSQICVTEVIDAGHFWAHYGETETFTALRQLQENINSMGGRNLSPLSRSQLAVGCICLALFDGEFYRARIEAIEDNQRLIFAQVFFVDYGNCSLVDSEELRECPNQCLELPFQAIECQLAHIRPRHGKWTAEANAAVQEVILNQVLIIKVFSVIRRVLRVDVYFGELHLNQLLIEDEHAEEAEETYASKQLATTEADEDEANLEAEMEAEIQQLGALRSEELGYDDFDDEIVKVSLRGPFTPYELSFSSMTKLGHSRAARIDGDSVCSVLLCEEPQDKHQRFMVSATVGVNATGNTLLASNCTLLPNIHGIASIVPLIFAPYVEYRADKKLRHYIGALCGLGYDPKHFVSLCPDHDMELQFDVELSQADITEINGIRTCLNLALGNDDMLKVWGSSAIQRIQESARDKVKGLLLKPRETVELERYAKAYRWGKVASHLSLNPYPNDDPSHMCGVPYPLHKGIFLTQEEKPKDIRIVKMKEEVRRLHELAGRSTDLFSEEVVCPLCFVRCKHALGLSLHMESRLHQMEEQLLFKEKK